MSDELAEGILRKMLESDWWGGYISVEMGVVDVRVTFDADESAYLARLQGEVQAEAEAARARSVSESADRAGAETPTDG